jgi:hypothetical protein
MGYIKTDKNYENLPYDLLMFTTSIKFHKYVFSYNTDKMYIGMYNFHIIYFEQGMYNKHCIFIGPFMVTAASFPYTDLHSYKHCIMYSMI